MSEHSSFDRREPVAVDSTQTLRAISESELHDSQKPKWYAVQLVVSDKPFNLDMMPRLEIFAAHRLYAIAARHERGTWHALRLGFFPDEQSAEVICGYLQAFFSSPTIVRVSTAEEARFAPTAAPRAAVQKPASAPASMPAAQRQESARKPVKAGGAKMPSKKTRTLAEALLEEAREVQLARSGKKPTPEQSGSWLRRLFGRPNERPRSTSHR